MQTRALPPTKGDSSPSLNSSTPSWEEKQGETMNASWRGTWICLMAQLGPSFPPSSDRIYIIGNRSLVQCLRLSVMPQGESQVEPRTLAEVSVSCVSLPAGPKGHCRKHPRQQAFRDILSSFLTLSRGVLATPLIFSFKPQYTCQGELCFSPTCRTRVGENEEKVSSFPA